MALRIEIYGDEHPFIAINYNDIAGIYYRTGEYKKALSYYEKAIAILKKTYGDVHPRISDAYMNMAAIFLKTQNRAKFDEYMELSKKSSAEEIPLLNYES